MYDQICSHYMFGYCKYKESCVKQHVKGECKKLAACKSKVCLKRHPKVCKRFAVEKFCKYGPGCAYLHRLDPSAGVQKNKDIENDLKIKLLEEEVVLLRSQILQLGVMTQELSDKVDLMSDKKDTEFNATEAQRQASENNIKDTYKDLKKPAKAKKYKCNQCSCTFKKDITLRKHKNTKHGQSQNELGPGQFGYVFDVRPGKEEDAELLRKEWRKDQQEDSICSTGENTSLSDIDEDDIIEDSEDDEAFLAKYDNDGNFIG